MHTSQYIETLGFQTEEPCDFFQNPHQQQPQQYNHQQQQISNPNPLLNGQQYSSESCLDVQYHEQQAVYNQQLLEIASPSEPHASLVYQQHMLHFNGYIDSRIDTLKGKITNLQRELTELEKLSNNPEQLSRIANSGMLDKGQLGRIHTQIIIDAEQSITENVIKVNSIHKKYIGYENIQETNQKENQQKQQIASNNQQKTTNNNEQVNQQQYQQQQNIKQENFVNKPCAHHQQKQQQQQQQESNTLKLKQDSVSQFPINRLAIKESDSSINYWDKQKATQYGISDQDYLNAVHIAKPLTDQSSQLNNTLNNLQTDPFGVQYLHQNIKKDPQYLQTLNYKPPQANPFGNQRVRSLMMQHKNEFSSMNNYNSHRTHIYQRHNNRTLDMRVKDSKSYSSMMNRKRSKYKMLDPKVKFEAVNLANMKGAKTSANTFGVPLKSLKRWMKVGWQRKKGGGRKTKDPEMEKQLYSWYLDMKTISQPVTAKMIKERAIRLSQSKDFIASKGWLDKFKIRYNLDIAKESATIHQIGTTVNVHSNSSNSQGNQERIIIIKEDK